MIFSNDNYVIFENIDEAIDKWDEFTQPLKVWVEDGKLKIPNAQSKTISFTKTQAKKYFDESVLDDMMKEIKQNAGIGKKASAKNVSSKLQTIHDSICNQYKINPRDEHLPIRLICLLTHLTFENLTLEEFEKRVHTRPESTFTPENDKFCVGVGFASSSSSDDEESEEIEYEEEHFILPVENFYYTNFYDKAINLIRNTDYSNIVEQLKEIKTDINLLLTQFRQYNGKKETNDTIETEEILCNMISQIALKTVEHYGVNVTSVVEYCGGMGNLSRNFAKYINKDASTDSNVRFDIIEKIDEVAFLNQAYNVANNLNFNVIRDNCISSNDYKVGLLNPPYNEKLLASDNDVKLQDKKVLKFVLDTIDATDICVSFFPCNKISTVDDVTNELKARILDKSIIPFCIKLGDKLFPGIGAGQIVIMVAVNKRILTNTEPIKTKIYEFDTNRFIKKKIRGNLTFVKNGKNEFENLINDLFKDSSKYLINEHELKPNNDWLEFNGFDKMIKSLNVNDNTENLTDENLKQQFDKILESIIAEDVLNNYVNSGHFDQTEFDNIKKEFNELKQHELKKIRLLDYFERINAQQHNQQEILNINGEYNVISCSKENNGIFGKCDTADFNVSVERPLYTISTRGSCGFLFKQVVPFSVLNSVFVLKSLLRLPNEHFNLKLISKQLNTIFDSYTSYITVDKLNDIEVYIYN